MLCTTHLLSKFSSCFDSRFAVIFIDVDLPCSVRQLRSEHDVVLYCPIDATSSNICGPTQYIYRSIPALSAYLRTYTNTCHIYIKKTNTSLRPFFKRETLTAPESLLYIYVHLYIFCPPALCRGSAEVRDGEGGDAFSALFVITDN